MKYPATIMIYHIKSLEHMSCYELSLVIPEVADFECCTQKQSYQCEHSECSKHVTSVKIKNNTGIYSILFWDLCNNYLYGL